MAGELAALAPTAAFLGAVHVVLGPDHYLPFAFLARGARWSRCAAQPCSASAFEPRPEDLMPMEEDS
jgi:hypothetical protein